MAYVERPYVKPAYTSQLRLGDMLRMRGRNLAEHELARGDASARMWQTVGNTIAHTVQNVTEAQAQEKEKKKIEEKEAQLSRQDAAFMELLRTDPKPDPKKVIAIYGPQRGMSIAQGVHAFNELETGAVKDARETAGRLAVGMKASSPTLQAQFWPSIRAAAIKGGLGTPEDIPEQPAPEYLDAIIGWATGKEPEKPKTPEPFTLSPGQQRFNADGTPIANVPVATPPKPVPATVDAAILAAERDGNKAEVDRLLALKRRIEAAGRAPAGPSNGDPGPLETIIGPDGKPIRVARRDAVGQPPASASEKPASGLQKRTLNFFNRAQQADLDLEVLEPEIAGMNIGEQTWMQWAPNFAQTETGQLYTQAQRAFTEARLRKDSGAAIPDTEFENDRKTYFAQPGDGKATLEQKRRARAAVLASLAFESGQALGEFVGDADEAARIVADYKTRAERKADAKTPPPTAPLRNPFRK